MLQEGAKIYSLFLATVTCPNLVTKVTFERVRAVSSGQFHKVNFDSLESKRMAPRHVGQIYEKQKDRTETEGNDKKLL